MAVYKRGGVWWYGFVFNGQRIQESSKQKNKRAAEQMEAAHRTSLAKGEVGLRDKKPVPTLRGFGTRFQQAIQVRSAEKPRTISFYEEKLRRLLEFDKIAGATLDEIDESLIEEYVQYRRETVAPGTVNRQLATLRRMLRLAYEWKIISRVPRIRLLPGERVRDFVLSREAEKLYLELAPQPLHDLALLVLDTGLRIGEALALEWGDVHLSPVGKAKFGYLQVQKGKSQKARRTISLTARANAILSSRSNQTIGAMVFARPVGKPYVGTYLDRLHQRVREKLKLPADFVIHSLRHTMLTRLGEAGVDAFTIMRIAGHSAITVSQRYVHPSTEAMERAFERLEALNATMDAKVVEAEVLVEPTTVSTTVAGQMPVTH